MDMKRKNMEEIEIEKKYTSAIKNELQVTSKDESTKESIISKQLDKNVLITESRSQINKSLTITKSLAKRARLNSYGKRDEIPTPKALYDHLDKEFHFDFDPCPLERDEKVDGLKIDWGKCNFVNPPYSDIPLWLQKGVKEMEKGKKSVFLITARTQNLYWHDIVFPKASEIRFMKRGIVFDGFERAFPVGLAIVIFDPQKSVSKWNLVNNQFPYFTNV